MYLAGKQWLSVDLPENLNLKPDHGADLRPERQTSGPSVMYRLENSIEPDWLRTNGFHEIEADIDASSTLVDDDHSIAEELKEIVDDSSEMTHSVAVNIYPATNRMPQLTIVVIDTIPIELKRSYMVWSWFVYAGR